VHPDWLGNPHHFVVGAALALVVAYVAPRIGVRQWWITVALAVGVTMAAEAVVELLEYPLKYSGDPNVTAYLDTVSDLASSLLGAMVGAAAGVLLGRGGR
jgi:hypothetical protein